jgi:Zn-dependent metalloprotease
VVGLSSFDLACSRGGSAGGTTPPGGLTQLEADTGIKWKLITFGRGVEIYPLGTPAITLAPGSDPAAAAVAFFAKYGGIWGIVDANEELLLDGSSTLSGRKYASFLQSEGGVGVDGTRFSVAFDDVGHVKDITGKFFPSLHGFPTRPALSPDQAAAAAEADMEKTLPAGATLDPRYPPLPHLLILPGTYPVLPAPTLGYFLTLSYRFDAGPQAHGEADRNYYVDANSGAVLASASALQEQYTGTDVAAVTGMGQGELPTTPARSINVLRALDGGASHAPYYMQQNLSAKPELYVVLPAQGTPVFSSPRLDAWDTQAVLNALPNQNAGSRVDPGSAVDAYFYLGEADQWWRKTGRNGWDNQDGTLSVRVHDAFDYTTNPPTVCANNANWARAQGQVTVCPRSLLSIQNYVGAVSVDLGMMGHEYQHAVSDAAFGGLSTFAASLEARAISESLSDVFGEFIMHDYETSNANCILGNVVVPSAGLRNLFDPHATPSPGGPQPDFYQGRYYDPSTSDPHVNDGVANKAWSLMTFGGSVEEGGGRRVPSNLAIGWDKSEALYIQLTWMQRLDPTSTFHELAKLLDSAAAVAAFSDPSQVRLANACAWYAVGVATKDDLASWLDIDPCTCGDTPEAGTCDAGTDAGSDGGNVYNRTYNCLVNVAEGGTAFECITQQQFTAADAVTACAIEGSDPFTSRLVASCPAGALLGCCRAGASQTCAYDSIAWDGLKLLCTAENGTLNSSGNAPSSPDAAPPGDGGHDGGTDASADATLPPHC